MKRGKLIGIVLLASAVLLAGVLLFRDAKPGSKVESEVQAAVVERASGTPAADSSAKGAESDVSAPVYTSPVDFETLWAMNPDIYAWLYIPDTEINYPVLQRDGDDGYYLKHGSDGRSSAAGAVFTESAYNGKDFSDPATAIYGHHMKSGAIFGSLQALYSTPEGVKAHPDITVYLPERELHYRVFAAVPFDMRHVLYYHDFSDPEQFQAFLDEVFSVRSINASFDEEAEVKAEDQLLILSTCLQGNSKRRYLVLAALTAELPDS